MTMGAVRTDARTERSGVDRADTVADLFERHGDSAFRLAYLMTGDRAVAEDITQEAFVRLIGRFVHLTSREHFDRYVDRTIVNLCRSYFRRRKIERRWSEAQHAEAPLPTTAEKDEELWAQLLALPPRQRAAVALRYCEDLSERQTADILGVSVGTVKSLTNRGLQELRRKQGAKDE